MLLYIIKNILERFPADIREIGINHYTLLFAIFLLSLAVLASIKIFGYDYINKLFVASYQYKELKDLHKLGKLNFNILNIGLDFIAIISISVFAFNFYYKNTGIFNIIIYVAIIYFIKLNLSYILFRIFFDDTKINLHYHIVSVFYKVFGLIFLPLIFICTYLPPEIKQYAFVAVIFLTAMALIFRIGITYRKIDSTFEVKRIYNLLYITTFEIVPILFLAKLIKWTFSNPLI